MTPWIKPAAVRGPALTDHAYTRRCAVEYATIAAQDGIDWQQIQWDLLNKYPYGLLFEGRTEDDVMEETMAIIRDGERQARKEDQER